MHNFRVLSTIVQASRIGPNGSVEVNGQHLIGDAGMWAVVGSNGDVSMWTDEKFRTAFEPADEDARAYLILVTLP